MQSYFLNRPICAVVLNNGNVSTSLRAEWVLSVLGPSREVRGLVEVRCKRKRYAVMQADLDEYGSRIESATLKRM